MKQSGKDSIQMLTSRLRDFAAVRDWQKFHNPKDLAMALQIEAGELAELFLWKSGDESFQIAKEKRAALLAEVADVFIYLVHLSIAIDCDLVEVALEKVAENEGRYPVRACFGKNAKYTDYLP